MSPLKSLHLYSRTPSDLQTSTNFGGVLSIVTMSIMGALLYANLRELLELDEAAWVRSKAAHGAAASSG